MNKSQDNTLEARSVVTFHTSPSVRRRLDVLAKATDRSRSFLANEAVERYLAEEEDFISDVESGLAEADADNLIPHEAAVAYLQALGTKKPLSLPKVR